MLVFKSTEVGKSSGSCNNCTITKILNKETGLNLLNSIYYYWTPEKTIEKTVVVII